MSFNIKKLSTQDIAELLRHKIWSQECPVALEDLSIIKLKHYDFTGLIKDGEIMVNHQIAHQTLEIFQELFKIKFPIHSVKLISEFGGDDELSMEANNSSAFNYRKIAGTNNISKHSYGVAIDINPLQNPYITKPNEEVLVQPSGGKAYLNRNDMRPGMVEEIVSLFKSRGFDWGGDWTSIKDYHHFEYPLSKLLLAKVL